MRLIAILFVFGLFSPISFAESSKGDFTSIYSFGDSFNYGGTWTEKLAGNYDLDFTSGKHMFATSGATASDGINNQLPTYFATSPNPGKEALYTVYYGPSDFAQGFGNAQVEVTNFTSSKATPATALQQLIDSPSAAASDLPVMYSEASNRAANLARIVSALNAADSGKLILVFNHFTEYYRQGFFRDNNSMLQTKLWKTLYNKELYGALGSTGANIVFVDYNRLVDEIVANPGEYFAQSEINSSFDKSGFFDTTSHPTDNAHRLTANYVASILEAPTRVAMTQELPIKNANFALAKIRASSGYDHIENISIETGYDFAKGKKFSKRNLGFSQNSNFTPSIYTNYLLNENLVVGANLHYFHGNFDFVASKGSGFAKESLLLLRSLYRDGSLFSHAALGLGYVNYEIERKIILGNKAITKKGKTNGIHSALSAGIGARQDLKIATISPFTNLSYQNVGMKDYTENGELNSTRMSFKIPDRKSLLLEFGAKLATDFASANSKFSPFVSLSYLREFMDTSKAKAKISDMPGYFAVNSYRPAKSYFDISTGLSAEFGKYFNSDLNFSIMPMQKIALYSGSLSIKLKF